MTRGKAGKGVTGEGTACVGPSGGKEQSGSEKERGDPGSRLRERGERGSNGDGPGQGVDQADLRGRSEFSGHQVLGRVRGRPSLCCVYIFSRAGDGDWEPGEETVPMTGE